MAIAGLLFVGVSHSSTPAEDFLDKRVLERARAEVSLMNAEQLHDFIEYLSVCSSSAEAPEKEFLCDVAKTRVELKNPGSPELRNLMGTLYLHDRMISRQWDNAKGDEGAQLARFIQRSVEIYRSLGKAASARYDQLARLTQ